MKKIIRLEPVFKYRVWGGKKLKEHFGYNIPTDKTGECWVISAHKNGDCIIKNGEFKGKTLSWIYKNHREYFGDIESKEFPLLAKLIDASSNLSIQVHPDDEYAYSKENGQSGKAEAWYIIDCNEDTILEYGHSANTREELVNYIQNGNWNKLLKFRPIRRGEFYYLPSGTVHAICKNTLVYEIQQSSDLTYRVYDYDRVDEKTGKRRELHVEKAIEVIKVPFREENNIKPIIEKKDGYVVTHYLSSQYFNIEKLDIEGKACINYNALFLLVTVIDGKGNFDEEEIKKGDNFIVPFGYNNFEIDGKLSFIISSI